MNALKPWNSEAFTSVSKDEFYKHIKTDKRDIMPQSIHGCQEEGGIYSAWKVQARGVMGTVVGYTYSINPKIGGQKNERYVLHKDAIAMVKGG